MPPRNSMPGHARTPLIGQLSGDTCPGMGRDGGRTGVPIKEPCLSYHQLPAVDLGSRKKSNRSESCPDIGR